ncbi:MAG TPA: HlyD family efflux transporter periplasmic adaptor subunit [Casimicrobiaceae bacterium]|jgi:HlyD family secretion protein|nr:HlyD family efflux transporter periplasmic adaptor subunit [Casimicrobiaceae bacterium]
MMPTVRGRLIALAAGLCLVACGPPAERALQGYVEGEYVRVAAPFAGTLQKLAVQRGAEVASGAPLFALESDNEMAARRQAEQQLQAAEARLANLMTGKRAPEVEMVAEQLRQAQAARELSAANLRRQEALFKSGFISKAALDDVRTQLQRDDAAVSQLQASVATAKLPGRPDEIRAAEADAAAARQALAQADWRLSQRAVSAPTTARVSDTYYVVGDWVPAGGVVASLLPAGNVSIRFFVPETELGRIKSGQTVSFSCDGCGPAMSATVSFISDRAEFTPPVLYSKENRAKLVYLVEAKPAADVAAKLNAGQPVDVVLPKAG